MRRSVVTDLVDRDDIRCARRVVQQRALSKVLALLQAQHLHRLLAGVGEILLERAARLALVSHPKQSERYETTASAQSRNEWCGQ